MTASRPGRAFTSPRRISPAKRVAARWRFSTRPKPRAALSITGPPKEIGRAVVCSSDLSAPGPRIHIPAPYITGEAGGGSMAILNSPEAARRFVDYWSAEGATWIKAYTDIRRAELGAAIQEAHKRGIKVTGHL